MTNARIAPQNGKISWCERARDYPSLLSQHSSSGIFLFHTETKNLRVLKDKLYPDASVCYVFKGSLRKAHRDTNVVFTRNRALPSGELILLLIQQSNLNRPKLSIRVCHYHKSQEYHTRDEAEGTSLPTCNSNDTWWKIFSR